MDITWGKQENSESDLECVCREVSEELSGTRLENMRYYGEFCGMTPYKKYSLIVKVYFADIAGELCPPSAEIGAAEWANNTENYVLSDITQKIIGSLKIGGYL